LRARASAHLVVLARFVPAIARVEVGQLGGEDIEQVGERVGVLVVRPAGV
jgi:hypothetical protein